MREPSQAITLGAVCLLSACATGSTRADGSSCNGEYACADDNWFASRVTVDDDAMEPVVRYHTDRSRYKYFPASIFAGISHDFYFLVQVNRETPGHAVFLVGTIENDYDWTEPDHVYFPRMRYMLPLDRDDYDVDCGAGKCDYTEYFSAQLTPTFISEFLDTYGGPYGTAEVRFNGRLDVDRTIRSAELMAVLQAAGVAQAY